MILLEIFINSTNLCYLLPCHDLFSLPPRNHQHPEVCEENDRGCHHTRYIHHNGSGDRVVGRPDSAVRQYQQIGIALREAQHHAPRHKPVATASRQHVPRTSGRHERDVTQRMQDGYVTFHADAHQTHHGEGEGEETHAEYEAAEVRAVDPIIGEKWIYLKQINNTQIDIGQADLKERERDVVNSLSLPTNHHYKPPPLQTTLTTNHPYKR